MSVPRLPEYLDDSPRANRLRALRQVAVRESNDLAQLRRQFSEQQRRAQQARTEYLRLLAEYNGQLTLDLA